MIVDLAERDAALFRKLEIASAADGADDETLAARLGKAIDQATATRGYVEYGEAGGWAAGVDEALDAIEALDPSRDRLLLKLAEHAIDRIETAIGSIDDSNGECGNLLERARDLHIRAARSARPDPIALARDLFERETGDGYGTFDDAAWLYADALGEAGLAEYRRLATEAWEKLPPLSARSRKKAEDDYAGLSGILDRFAAHDGDVEARIALRAKDLSSSWKYFELAEFCLRHKSADEALRWAEDGLWAFEDGPSDARLALFAADLLVKADRGAEAVDLLRRTFERSPDFNVYLRWRDAGGEAALDPALAAIERRAGVETGFSFGHPADLGVKILMYEKRFDLAWAMARKHRVSLSVKERLARESEAGHPREALEVYARRVEELANGGGNRAYEEAAGLIARMGALARGRRTGRLCRNPQGTVRPQAQLRETAGLSTRSGETLRSSRAGRAAMTGSSRILVIGDVMTDVIVRPEGPLAIGSDRRAAITVEPGGSAANQAAWLASFGVSVDFVARVGASDVESERARFEAIGVTPHLVGDAAHETGRLVALIDPDGERSFLTDRGANDALEAADIPDALIEGAAHIHLSGYSFFAPSPRAAVLDVMRRAGDKPVSVDPASAEFLREAGADAFLAWTRGASILFPNAEEAAILAGSDDPETQCARLAARYPLVVVKRGADGAIAAEGSRRSRIDARKIEAIDTTGAGDAFVAAFLGQRLAGADIEPALERAVSAGAAASTRVGGRPGPPGVHARPMDMIVSFDRLAAVRPYTYLRPQHGLPIRELVDFHRF